MWFKKKSVLQAENHYDTEKSADNTTDLRTTWKDYQNASSSIGSGVPSAADTDNYFYLPALGFYIYGQLNLVGNYGSYWSSSANPVGIYTAYVMTFNNGNVYVGNGNRFYGYRAQKFSDFGED